MSFPMSSRPSLVPVAGVAALLALLTGAATWLASGKPLVGLIGLIGALAAAVAVMILSGTPTPAPVPPTDDADRTTLVQALIYLRDRVTSTALAGRLDQALRQVGVSTVEPTGERFDPSHHEAGGTLPTADKALVGMIATVEAPGYADHGVLLRPPVVTVYQRRQA
jgi:molecular chaperone GrpE